MSNALKLIVDTIEQHHGEAIRVLDFRSQSASYDYFVIVTASNSRLAWAMVDYLEEVLSQHSVPLRSCEGQADSRWILLDCYDVIVHIFIGEERAVYQLDQLWGDLPEVRIE